MGRQLAARPAPSTIVTSATVGQRAYRGFQRAQRINQAILSFQEREGRYPDQLSQLMPRDLLYIPPPVIIYGQNWCYQTEQDSYLFGYIDREHWSSPHLNGETVSSHGDLSALDPICSTEIAALRQREPYVFYDMDD